MHGVFSKKYSIFLLVIIILVQAFILLRYYLNQTKFLVYKDKSINSVEVVIARYNEDISWIPEAFPNIKVSVYNKGKDDISLPKQYNILKLPNIGRESHTYLHHIIENYNNLPERILFLQADPDYNWKTEIVYNFSDYWILSKTRCNNIIAWDCSYFDMHRENERLKFLKGTKWDNTQYKDYDFREFFKKYIILGELDKHFYLFSYGANFAIDRDKVLLNDIEYYKRIINTLDNIAPVEGHYLERSWDSIFEKH